MSSNQNIDKTIGMWNYRFGGSTSIKEAIKINDLENLDQD
jgi:hypothetical protein